MTEISQSEGPDAAVPPPMARGRSVLFNAAWNYAGSISNLLITLLTTPLYLHRLGLEQFGVLAIIMAVTGPLMVINAGVTQSAIKFVAQHAAANRLLAARGAAWASFCMNLALGLVGAAVCVVLSDWLVLAVFKVDPAVAGAARTALKLAGGIWLATQLAMTFRGVLEGLRDQRRVVMTDMAFSYAMAAVCSLAAWLRPRIDVFVGMQLAVTVVWIFVWAWLARRALGGLGLEGEPLRPHLREVREYSSWQIVNSFFGVAAGVTDRYLIGIVISTATLGAYNVALRVQTAARLSYFGVNQALFPAVSAALGRPRAAEELTLAVTWRLMATAAVAAGFAFVFAPSFLVLWVGPEVAAQAGWALRWLLVAVVLEIPSATCSSYLFARGLNRTQALVNIVTTMVTLVAMFGLGWLWGVPGVAACGAVSLVLTRIPFHLRVHRQHFSAFVGRAEFLMTFYGIASIVLCVALPAGWWFDRWFAARSTVAGFSVALATVGAAYSAVVYTLVFVWPSNRRRLAEVWGVVHARLVGIPWFRRFGFAPV